ncbi:hypothetical protein [Paracidovorax valerianellae]|uniref:hypothetical protein n=1 Tax=Paracidovorax valerianellae TaxID=187868 RepID=UPI001113FEF5|nr:hypothetical protein [Paracidovorax valerianellae]MDA8447741.1 hypothetical protein [Paracidovorax valerianellae]
MIKKFGITVLILICITILVSFVGRKMIESSPVYEYAKNEVEKKLGISSAELSIPMLRTFKFSEGVSTGEADFFLCNEKKNCYQIHAEKVNGHWGVVIDWRLINFQLNDIKFIAVRSNDRKWGLSEFIRFTNKQSALNNPQVIDLVRSFAD